MDIEIYIKDQLLRAYLPGLFERDGNMFIASDKSLTGAVICALVKTSPIPRRHVQHGREGIVAFRLAKSDYNVDLLDRHLHLTPTSEARIIKVLRREFETNFNAFIVDHKQSGINLKEAIELFIIENQMELFFEGDIDTLKKRAYRYQVLNLKKAQERLRQLVYTRQRYKR